MKYKTLLFLNFLAAIALATSCSKDDIVEHDLTPKTLELTAEAPIAIQSSNEFGIGLFTKVAGTEHKNIMLSPLSASTALTMLLNGCGGDTYSQLKGTLKYPDGMTIADINAAYKGLVEQLLNADPKVTLALANAIFYRNDFVVKPPFLAAMNTGFKADIEGLDFSAPSAITTINKWASDNTNGKIPAVLNEISGDAVMFIMNALYFKGDWSYQFDKSKTTNRPFHPDGSTTLDVTTMNGEIGSRVVSASNFKAIEMPYGRTNFTMVVIVPDGTLNDFYPSFTHQTWIQLTSDLDGIEEFGKTIVYMPKFKFSYEKFLNDQLKSLGMVDAFLPFRANLSGISDQSIFVSFVKQNTFVDVDEEGTEAAAVTTIGIELTSLPPQPKQFVIDKPFIFAIRERTTNTLLFIGQVLNPQANK
jgi:serpin B